MFILLSSRWSAFEHSFSKGGSTQGYICYDDVPFPK
jgi:hypothetical protein